MKRKRDESLQTRDGVSAKRVRIDFKLNSGISKIRHALKVARAFEGQKTIKRKKKALSEDDQQRVLRIEQEAAALKTLDLSTCAKHHLYKTLCKYSAVARHPDLPDDVRNVDPLTQNPALLNAVSRLYKATPVVQALDGAISEVSRALGVQVEPVKGEKKKRLRAKDYSDETTNDRAQQSRNDLPPSPSGQQTAVSSSLARRQSVDDSSDSDASQEARLAGSSSADDVDGDEVEALEKRLLEEGLRERPNHGTSDRYDVNADLSLSESEADSGSTVSESRTRIPARQQPSMYMSALTSGYIDGSGSDIEDFDAMQKSERRNRRGQRARQAIAEHKFGAKAKHLQKQQAKAGWDSKRGAVETGDRRKGARKDDRTKSKSSADKHHSGFSRDLDRKPGSAVSQNSTTPMHPSWEAAKRLKEKKEGSVAFQGKRITFD